MQIIVRKFRFGWLNRLLCRTLFMVCGVTLSVSRAVDKPRESDGSQDRIECRCSTLSCSHVRWLCVLLGIRRRRTAWTWRPQVNSYSILYLLLCLTNMYSIGSLNLNRFGKTTNVLWIWNCQMLLHMLQADVLWALTRWQHFSAVLKVWCQIENLNPSIGAYLREEQSC